MKSNYKIVIYPKAKLDVENIFKYIQNDLANPQAALDFLDEFYNTFYKLRYFPESHQVITNEYIKDKTLRKVSIKNYLAFYRVKENEIQIIRILYGMSNYQEIL